MAFVWESGRDLAGIKSRWVMLERGRQTYGGLLWYNPARVPCLLGYNTKAIEGEYPQLIPLRQGDRLTLLK